jgi:gluconokinase
MNPKLFDSQLVTLEPPVDAFRVVNDKPPGEIVDQIMKQLAE